MSQSVGLFEPDPLIAQQFYSTLRTKGLSWPKLMMLWQLEDALRILRDYYPSYGDHGYELALEAFEWLQEENDPAHFAFKHICDVLDLPFDKMRTDALNLDGTRRLAEEVRRRKRQHERRGYTSVRDALRRAL